MKERVQNEPIRNRTSGINQANQNQTVSMFGPSVHLNPPPPPRRPPPPNYTGNSNRNSRQLISLAESNYSGRSDRRPKQQNILQLEQLSQVGQQAKNAMKKGWTKGMKKSREGVEEVRQRALPAVQTVRSAFRQISSPSSSSFDTASNNSSNIEVVDVCPADFHPAFMHGNKHAAVPGLHPPSYEDALRDPKEPPTYAQPPPMPPSKPPPTCSTSEIESTASSGPYGPINRIEGYPDFENFYDLVDDVESIPEYEDENEYENLFIESKHNIIDNNIYDTAGPCSHQAVAPPPRNGPPALPPRNKKNKKYALPRKSEPEVLEISPESSIVGSDIVRVTSNIKSSQEDPILTKSDYSKVNSKQRTNSSKLKRLISDPIALKNPFNPTIASTNASLCPSTTPLAPPLVDQVEIKIKPPLPKKENDLMSECLPVPKIRSRICNPVPPPRRSLLDEGNEIIEHHQNVKISR